MAVLSVAASLDRSLGKEARALLGGDIELRSARPLDPAAEAPVQDLARRGADVVRVKEMVAMARNPGPGPHAPGRAEGGRSRLSALRTARHHARAPARRAARRRRSRRGGGRPRPPRPRSGRHARRRRRDAHREGRPPEGAGSGGVPLHAGPARPPGPREPRGDGTRPIRQPCALPHPAAPAGSARARRGARRAGAGDGGSGHPGGDVSTRPSPACADSSTSSRPTSAWWG